MDPAPIPVLHTERLLLRGWQPSDFEAHAEMCADPEVQRFLGGPLDRADSWISMALSAGHWVLRGYGNWVLERRSDGRVIGRAGLWYPEGWFGIEVTWKLARAAWGHGYATEAARATLDWAWPRVNTDRLISVIDPVNTASMRVAERIGMRRLREDEALGKTMIIMGIDRPNDLPAPTAYSV